MHISLCNSSQKTSWSKLIWYCARWFRSYIEVNSSTKHNILAICSSLYVITILPSV